MARSTANPPVLAGFEYVRLLGSGGFSDVFLYNQNFPKRRVAVKVLLIEDLSPTTRAAFAAEANLMAQLSAHPYIVAIYQADVAEDDRPYFVMEYCSGPSLGDRYKRERFSVADVLQIGIRLSSAIATAHSVGILHRDIKPANVLTNDFGWPALTDFGIASAVEAEIPTQTTTSRPTGSMSEATTGSASVGMSIPWSPPEMFEDVPDPDVRSDVFSLAATIYTLLAGHTPFEVRGRSNSSVDLVGRIVRGAITPLDREDVPRSLLAVLQKGMAAAREDRFATAADFARALQRVELELSYAQTPFDVPNLLVKAPQRPDPDDEPDPDATRARSISTVHAQTPRSPVDAGETKLRSTPAVVSNVEPTVVRRSPARVEPDATVIRPKRTSPVEISEAEAPTKRSKIALVASGIIAVLVVGAVIVSIIVVGSLAPSGNTAVVDPGGRSEDPSAVSGGVVPTPVLVSKSMNGTTASFVWSNPDPQTGDSFVWQRTDGPQDGRVSHSTTEPNATIPDVNTGDTVCIKVDLRRQNAAVSANSLEVCLP